MTTPGTASTSDARKRRAERETEQPPTLPDTSEALALAETIHVIAGSRFTLTAYQSREVWEASKQIIAALTPPPAPAPVWSVISTDRDQPTLARVRLGERVQPVLREWYRAAGLLFSPNTHGRFDSQATCHLSQVSSVEVVRTCLETQVPVERSLIAEAAAWEAWPRSAIATRPGARPSWEIFADLAALADGAELKGADQ